MQEDNSPNNSRGEKENKSFFNVCHSNPGSGNGLKQADVSGVREKSSLAFAWVRGHVVVVLVLSDDELSLNPVATGELQMQLD